MRKTLGWILIVVGVAMVILMAIHSLGQPISNNNDEPSASASNDVTENTENITKFISEFGVANFCFAIVPILAIWGMIVFARIREI
jgi:hypothetical protein